MDVCAPSRLLALVADLEPPRFLPPDEGLAGLPAQTLRDLQSLNPDQYDAVARVVCAQVCSYSSNIVE